MAATHIGIFFDGTGNYKDRDIPKKCETNVVKLFELYNVVNTPEFENNRKFYCRGVGSRGILDYYVGGFTGAGGDEFVTQMLQRLTKHCNQSPVRDLTPKIIDVCGFSRGAAEARHFVNVLKHEGIVNKATGDIFSDIEVRFLGLFDTVASFGIPGNEIDPGFDFHVDNQYVANTVHFIAEHELRNLFDLMSLKESATAALPVNMIEMTYPGAHSDVGGGYGYQPFKKGHRRRHPKTRQIIEHPDQPEKFNDLSRIPLHAMYQKMENVGIDMIAIANHPRYLSNLIIRQEVDDFYQANKQGSSFDTIFESPYVHDSRYIKATNPRGFIDASGRDIFYPQPYPDYWAERKKQRDEESDDE